MCWAAPDFGIPVISVRQVLIQVTTAANVDPYLPAPDKTQSAPRAIDSSTTVRVMFIVIYNNTR